MLSLSVICISSPSHSDLTQSVKFDMSYTDSISMSLSTAYLFNYPMSSFARLPVSLTISLDLFESSVSFMPV